MCNHGQEASIKMKNFLLAVILFLALVSTVRAEGNFTINVYDEQSQQLNSFIMSIANGTKTINDGRFSTFSSEVDTTGFWTPASIEQSCDYVTATSGTETCNNGGGCAANTIELYCLVAAPWYIESLNGPRLNFSIRWAATAGEQIQVDVYDISSGSYTGILGPLAGSGLATITTNNVVLGNDAGRYGTAGTMIIRIRNNNGYANADAFQIYDMWSSINGNAFPPTIPTSTDRYFRSTFDDRDSGGIPYGESLITLSSDQYQTANDYAQRHYYITETDLTNVTLRAFLLKSSVGTTQIFNTLYSEQPLDDVLIVVQRNMNGSFETVDSIKTSGGGIGTVFVQPGIQYQLIASKTGYGIQTVTFTPVVSLPITIRMQRTSAVNFITLFADISYLFVPNSATLQVTQGANNTVNLTMIAFNNNLAAWGFNATLERNNGSNTQVFSGISTSAAGGFLPSTFNVTNASNYDTLHISAFFQRTGEGVNTFGRDYIILTTTPGNNSLFGVMSNLRNLGFADWQVLLIGVFISLALGAGLGVKGFGAYGIGISMLGVFGLFAYFGFLNPVLFMFLALAVGAVYVVIRGGL